MSSLFRGVWRHPEFVKLWAGQATSMFGSLIGAFAYSLVAIMTLHASPAEIAVLNGCNLVPGMIAGPWVGVLADRLRHRPLLIAADLARALILASIPIAALIHTLSMVQLYLVAATVSVLTMLFGVAFRAYMPLLLERDELIQGNSVLQGTDAVAEAGGFAAAGALVQIFTAPIAIAFDAVSFLLSSLSLLSIRNHNARVVHQGERPEGRASLHEILEGVQIVWSHPVLRAITLTTVAFELVGNAIGVVIMLFFVRDLHLTAGVLGPVFGIGGVSAFLGAILCGRVIRRLGLGHALIWSLLFNNIGMLATVVAGGPLPLVIVLLSLAQTTDAGRTIYEITVTSILQKGAPEGAAGRVFGTYETLKSAAMLGGLLVGGVLGQSIGLRPVLILALVANLLVPLALVFSPVRRIRSLAEGPVLERVAV